MKIFNASQVKSLDQYTILNEPILSIDLMERAAKRIFDEYLQTFDANRPVFVIAGPGNNGGDVLALTRLMLETGIQANALLINRNSTLSQDCQTNYEKLQKKFPTCLIDATDKNIISNLTDDTIIIDGLFGSGLNRPLTDEYAEIVNSVNQSNYTVVSIDIPSGLNGDKNTDFSIPIIKANYTFSLQFPKLAFLMADCSPYVGKWTVVDIKLHPKIINSTHTEYNYLEKDDVNKLIKVRPKYSHKGTFGHLLIFAGSKGMAGAAVLSAKSAYRSGVGLVTIHSSECNRQILQTTIPEAIFHADKNQDCISEHPNLNKFTHIAIGPGIGTSNETVQMLQNLLSCLETPCIIDADALNIIAKNAKLLARIPKNSILTPHPKEFERLFGKTQHSINSIELASEISKKLQLIIVLKGAHTLVALPDGSKYFNSTGNSGMATAGSGDVLTGIIAGLFSQGYNTTESALLGVYLHGLAGDIALEKQSKESLIASDIISNIGSAYKACFKRNRI